MTYYEGFQTVNIYKEGCLTRKNHQSFDEALKAYKKHKSHPHAVAGELLRITYKKGLFGKISVKSVFCIMDWARWKEE